MIAFNKEIRTIRQLVELYPQYREIDPDYKSHLTSRVLAFCDWVRIFGILDIAPDDLNPHIEQAWINELKTRGLKPPTIRGYFRNLRAVVNFDKELRDGKVVLPKVEIPTPNGPTRAEIKRLLKVVKKLKGKLKNGVKRRDFWEAAIHSAFSIGVRAGDMFRIRSADIPPSGRTDWIQKKTGIRVPIRFSRKAMKAIKRHGHEMAVPWPHSRYWFEQCFKKLLKEAGVEGITWKGFRCSAGSYADAEGRGHELLGNSRKVFEKHYRVPKIVGDEPPKQVAL